jgi:iron complex outermembrane receptor protein
MSTQVRATSVAIAFWGLVWSSLSAQEVGTLRGTVVNQATSGPVAGAIVSLRETRYRTQTNEDGVFVLSGIPRGEFSVTAAAIGLAPYAARITISPGQTTELEIRMAPTAVNLRELVVTASKTETEVRDVPAAVSVVSSADIERSGATNFTEAVKTVPGVSMGSFGENFNSVQLRGLPRFGNENEAVLVLVDGVPQTDARNSTQLLTIPIANIDRVEVVKGPNSALYGRTAIGGVVNMITEDPPAEPSFRFRLQGGQWDFIRGDVTAAGPLAAGSRSGYLISWTGGRQRSFHDFNAYSRRQSSLFGKFTTAPDAKTDILVSANYAISRGSTPTGDPIIDGRLLSDIDPTFSRLTNLNLPSAQYNEEHIRSMSRIRRDLAPGVSLTNTFGYRHSLWNFIDDGDFLSPPAAGSDTVVLFPFTRPREENAYYDDLRLEVNLGPARFQHRLLVGATLDRNTGTVATQFPFTDSVSGGVPISYRNPVFPGPTDFQQLDRGSRTYEGTFYGLYLQDEIAIARRLRITLGGRYDDNEVHAATSSGVVVDESSDKFSPKVGASFRVLDSDDPRDPQLSVYAQYARAFKPPQAPASITVALDPENPLTPEEITNYEAGIKATVWQGRLAFEASAFDMTRDGIAVLLRVGPGLDFRESSAGKQRFKGVELGVVTRPISALALHANYAFYDGKYEDFIIVENDQEVDLSGLRVNLSPRHMLDIGGTYESGSGLGLTLSGNYESSKALDPKNTFFLDSYFTVDGRVSWRLGNYTLALAATNIFDEEYATDGEITDPLYVFPAPPRRIFGEFGVTF